MPFPDPAVVTGAFSFTVRYVSRRMVDECAGVRTLTGHPDRQALVSGLV